MIIFIKYSIVGLDFFKAFIYIDEHLNNALNSNH